MNYCGPEKSLALFRRYSPNVIILEWLQLSVYNYTDDKLELTSGSGIKFNHQEVLDEILKHIRWVTTQGMT